MAGRIQSIDILRGLTMLLMIWVNDFWSLSDVPPWLQHMPGDADALGFSDVIFPAFLFIVGLSIPFACRARLRQGENSLQIAKHTVFRSAALLLMGLMMVNLESYDSASALLPKMLWQVLMAVSFVLIWNSYPTKSDFKSKSLFLRSLGWLMVALLLATFRSHSDSGYNWIEPHWWGILGLIGWSYLICALAQLYLGERLLLVGAAWLALSLINIAAFAPSLTFLAPAFDRLPIVSHGSLPALTMAGCFASVLYLKQNAGVAPFKFLALLLGIGLVCIVMGLLLRPWGGISKIQATPAWTQICTGISMLSFAAVYYIADIRKATAWAGFLKPAGVATLTCYLVPYLVYPAITLTGIELPTGLKSGIAGLAVSMAFACLIVLGTGLLNRLNIRLRI